MTYTPPEGVSIGTFTADTLPASFNAPAGAVISYKIYGTSEGAGVETENLWDESWVNGFYSSVGAYNSKGNAVASDPNKPIPVQGGITYYIKQFKNVSKIEVFFYSGATGGFISYDTIDPDVSNSFVTPQSATYIRFDCYGGYGSVYANDIVISIAFPTAYVPYGYKIPISLTDGTSTSNYDLFIGDTKLGEAEYVDNTTQKIYKLQEGVLTPTDPPLPLPSIITYDGENTISSTETLGDVEITGDWTAIMGSTEDESIDIEFTVDAEEYIAFVTVDDGAPIQVSDTITMPSSADSFTLEVVAWGRERYTDTVYNALS